MSKPKIAIVGCFQNGKSTFVNCLLDDKVAQTGFGLSTTHISTTYTYGDVQSTEVLKEDGKKKIMRIKNFVSLDSVEAKKEKYVSATATLWKPLLKEVDIIDTPGFNADSTDSKIALDSIKDADFILLLLRNAQLAGESASLNGSEKESLPKTEIDLLEEIAKLKLPFLLVVNCFDIGGAMWDPLSDTNIKFLNHIDSKIQSLGHAPRMLEGKRVWPCNLIWFWRASERLYSESEKEVKRLDSGLKSYFSNIEDGIIPASKELARRSNFLPLRNFLKNDILTSCEELRPRRPYKLDKDSLGILFSKKS